MPWIRKGDTSAHHPAVLAVLEDPRCDDRLLNEVYGFINRCAEQSAAHLTDYVVSRGTALALAGPTRVELIDIATAAGYWVEVEVDGKVAYKLLEDDGFIHMRSKEEIEWERQRKADNANPELTIPVRLRDGDACRYCGLVVNFLARRGQKGGTYDHLVRDVKSPDDMVVACTRCNSALLDSPRAHREKQLMPPPAKPYYKPRTREWLAEHDYVIAHNITLPASSEPDVKAGRVPPGRDRGTPATRAEQTPPATHARSEGLSGSQPECDPAGATASGPRDTAGSQPGEDPAEAPHSSGPPGITHEVGPADECTDPGPRDTAGSQPGEDPAGSAPPGGKTEHQRVPAETSRFQQKPADRVPTESRNAGTGRDGSGRAGSGRDGLARDGTGRQAAPAGRVPSHRAEGKHRRRRRR
ncbi:hypothetical protein [Brevibacterium gallinarum]|uniref:HNH endonuclease n=1 Tax=Brevibacterium gallinarum TaxID=2762220 RepID=A0ABR8WQN2_9MICO|nr:hypothetical protein [Brevibacterium gallinarum]MBD8019373.1 hypothetical protein [Brevibacterium gallinarum]